MERTSNWESLFGRRITRRRGLAAVGAGMAAALLAACGDDGESSLSNNIEWSQDGMNKVVSRDGTVIAFDRLGQGTPVILVAGALGVRAEPMMADLATALAPHHTVYNYDRRGRGDSGDTQPYAVEREIEDIEAILNAAGGSGSLYGLSSGAALILEAANKLPTKVRKLALYEPPFIVDDTHPPLPEDYVDQVNAMVASGRRGDAVALFMKVVGVPEDLIPQMRAMPMWPDMEKVAHTLAYDGTIMGDNQSGKPLAPKQWTSVTSPTLVIVGGESEPFFHHGAQALVEVLPNARRQVLEGQSHGVDAAPLAPVLVDFFAT